MTEQIFNTPYGKFTASEEADKRSFDRFKKGVFYQEKDVVFLQNFFNQESVVGDVGAHIGIMTIPFALHAKEVHSFEPVPATRETLEKNISINNLTNVKVYPYALGAQEREEFAHSESAIDAAQYTVLTESHADSDISVQVKRLDNLIEHADLLKIDAEGMEISVLEGAQKLLENNHPSIFCEINFGQLWAHHTSPQQIEKFLKNKGYEIFIPLSTARMGKVWSLSFITGLLHPAFFLRISRNFAFDIMAIMPDRIPQNMQVVSPIKTIIDAAKKGLLKRIVNKM
jgi:FkbM family methyltransferase